MTIDNYESIRKQVIKAGIEMAETKLTLGTWGNISARVPEEDCFAITPSGVDYNDIKVDGVVIINMEGRVFAGNMKPSIEWPMHLEIYKNRKDVNAVVHTHSAYCTAMAIARKPIPAAAEDMVQIVGGNVRVSKYFPPGSPELGKAAVEALEGRNAVILANHGCLAAGRDLKEAMKIAQIVEKSAKATIFAQILGGVVELSKNEIDAMRDFYLNQYGQR
ncbi:MAG TPA: class II aldolase/adducin family protein [Bacillota bacterium]|nr:class II aldolase/adducin family protein [Bacillota bacterium]HOR85984.1 class II aldolase/adducin family protein [Bacillota bacterium]HPL54205.1 class II aldolase/adducin family protein [Bacillota bacterium]